MSFRTNTLLLVSAAIACNLFNMDLHSENTVRWRTLGNRAADDGKNVGYTQRFTIVADEPFDGLAFCMFKRPMTVVDDTDTFTEILPGYFLVESPRFRAAEPGDTVTVDILTKGWLKNISYLPDGAHLVRDGAPVPVAFTRESPVTSPSMWLNPVTGADNMIYGEEAFITNDSLRSDYRSGAYNYIPTPKRITLEGSMVAPAPITVKQIADERPDYYRAVIGVDSITVYTSSSRPDVVERDVARRIERAVNADGLIPAGEIEDWADYGYRGLMIDVARNFVQKEAIPEIIDLMALYGLNTLHFHVGDDEGWRVEMPSLPELTEVGGHRGYTLTDTAAFLKGIYSGNGDPYDYTSPANGFFTADEFVEILRYADRQGIAVIPEFDTPGHSRAAIRAMEHRAAKGADPSYRLIEDGDTSVYTSAQAFHDNVMNPALEGSYRFWDTVFDDLINLYRQAGAPLVSVHIGGDEVPAHCWDGSAAVQQLKDSLGLDSQREVHAHFVQKVTEMAAGKGLKVSGWQEIALDHPDVYNRAVIPAVYSVNCWTGAGNKGVKMAQSGFPVVLSNVDYLYFDQTPTLHPEEPGLVWGGKVSEFSPLHATIDTLCPADSLTQSNVKGISAHIFAETVRDKRMIERYLLPRIMGLAERAHNSSPTLTDNEYFGLITAEMPVWNEKGKNIYLRQPGIRVNAGKIEMNEPYGLGEIRYTVDGTNPTRQSALYVEPFTVDGAPEIRARLFLGDSQSVVSILSTEP